MTLTLVPIGITGARKWIEAHHSHLHAPLGGLCAVAIATDGRICCVATLSRPVSRVLQASGVCAEINRVASDGTAPHAASKAIGALSRAGIAIGYRRLVSSTLLGEAGTSYRAAGWWPVAVDMRERDWIRSDGEREAAAQPGAKVRWEFGPDASPVDLAVDALVRASVGTIPLRDRPENLPLLAMMREPMAAE